MVELRRVVRANLGGGHPEELPSGSNGHAGQPPMLGLGAYYEFEVCCRGEPDPVTGYLINIKQIDHSVRLAVLPEIHRTLLHEPGTSPASLLPSLSASLASVLEAPLVSLRWGLSPSHSLEFRMSQPHDVLLRQRFEFSAAHRLHVPSLSADENRALFGKCNNPSGHGHNYELEVCIRLPVASKSMPLSQFERIVETTIIQRFDHKHLNIDTAEFDAKAGLNPSVENIARVCYDLLAPAIAVGSGNTSLESVTLWETPKTSCTYPA